MITSIVQAALRLLRVLGLWFLFKKCAVKPIWALVPIVNNIKLSQCADDEDSGYMWAFVHFLASLCESILTLLNRQSQASGTGYLIVLILAMIFTIIDIIYSIRIYSSLCRVFARKRGWVVGWLFLEPITAVIWGFGKGFQPVDADNYVTISSSGKTAETLAEGLTININKRTSRKSLFVTKTMLKDIHLNIVPGKMVLLLGGSGAGKTTFINAVTGYEPADATVTLNGTNVYKEFRKVIYDIGVVPQQELIRNTDTVFRTLTDAAALRMPANVSVFERRKRVYEVMDIFGLTPIKSHIIKQQSGGQKKRISIATEYISDPSLFILDEPDSGLDGILARELMQKLHDISREGKIVMVVTHTPDRVIDLFDEIIVLAKDHKRTGRLVFHGPVDDARAFFGVNSMEEIVRMINRPEEGGLGKADELVQKFNTMKEGCPVHG